MQTRVRSVSKSYRRKARYIALITTIAIIIGVYFYWVRTAPYRVVKSFVRAVERQDVETIYRLTIPQEREELGVTSNAIRTVLDATLWRHGKVIGKIDRVNLYGYWGIALGEWLNAETGQPVPAAFGPPIRPKAMDLAVSFVALTPEGWRVSTTRFLAGRDFQTFGSLALCRKAGLKGVIDVQTGHVITLIEFERQLVRLFLPSR